MSESLDILKGCDALYGRRVDRRRKPIEITAHAAGQMRARGVTVEEVIAVIRTATWRPARDGRLQCQKAFPHGAPWRGRYYRAKRVRVFFIEDGARIIVVTALTYYF